MDIRTQDADTVTRTSRTLTWAAVLLLLFAFRLGYGLSQEFFFEDETQIFLMGLRYYATVAWPFFGPDVVWTKSEIPGALQALLVGVGRQSLPVVFEDVAADSALGIKWLKECNLCG